VVLGKATERVRTVRAGKAVAAFLGVGVGKRIARMDRITQSADGLPVEWRIAYWLRS
jgi:DNA-binding GntR family transcriptional regulator